MRILPVFLLLAASAAPFVPSASACTEPWCDLTPDVCVQRVTHDTCWDGRDVCVASGYTVPQCVDVPDLVCTEICSAVSVCAHPDGCRDGHDVCVGGTRIAGFCEDVPEVVCATVGCLPPVARSAPLLP